MNITFASITHVQSEKIVDEFMFSNAQNKEKLKLTNEEQLYLKSHKTINICLQYNQFPYDGYVDGKHTGIMADIYKIISKDLALEFKVIPPSSLDELIANIENKKCEIFSIMPAQSKDFPNLVTSKSILKNNFTLISKLDKSFVQDPKQLEDEILVVQFQPYKDYLQNLYPYLNIEVEENTNKMMKKVLDGSVYASIEIDEKADYMVEKYGYGKLKINGFLAKDQPMTCSIGVQKDEPILFSILQKELDNISEHKIEHIINSWRLTRYENHSNYDLVIKILVLLGIVIFLMAYYQRKLKRFNAELEKQVKTKTKELRELNESLANAVEEKVNELIQKDNILTVQSKQAVMGEMLNMIAHQWRQPLSTITLQISNLEIDRMMGKDIDEKQIGDTLSQISDTMVYLSDTIDDFQTYFRTDKESTEIEIHELLQRIIKFALPRLKGKSINLEIKKVQDIHVNVYINELIQVILNIINNAIDSFEGLEKESKHIDLFVEDKDGMVEIHIVDNGCGILEENLKKLFEPSFSTKGKNGTGLGLYMSQKIIEKQFHGKIDVKSSPQGSTFIVSIMRNI